MTTPAEFSPLFARLLLMASMYVLLKTLSRSIWLHALVWWPATVMHELSHFLLGVVLRARPVGMSLWPRRIAGTNQLQLGHVAFADLRWWKALPVAIAPLMLLPPLAYIRFSG